MGIQNGKFFDVSNTRDYFAQLADEYDEYSKKAVVHQKALTNFTTTESWKGADADKAKSLIKSNKITLVDEVMALQLEAIELGENILDKFRVEVDNAVDARIEYDTLEKINDDYTIRYANYVDVSNLSYNQVASLQQRYSRYGNIRTPDYSMGQNYLIELCGGEDDASGFMFTCMQKLVKFDDEATAMVAEANIGERAEALRDRMQANNSHAGISKIFGRMVRGFDLRHMKIGSRRVISALFSGIFLKSRYGYKKGGKYSVIATPMVYKTTKTVKKTAKKSLPAKTVDTSAYSNYHTGNKPVDDKIDELFLTYGDDLSGLQNNCDLLWYNADENTKKAIVAIFESDLSFIDSHISDKNCKDYEAHVSNILSILANTENNSSYAGKNNVYVYPGGSLYYVFNATYINDFKNHCHDSVVKEYVSELKGATYTATTNVSSNYQQSYTIPHITFDVRTNDSAAVVFSVKNSRQTEHEILFHMSEARTEKCVEYWMNKGDYAFTLGLMDKDEIIGTYMMAENTYDLKFIDNLMKTHSDYKDVFTVNPEKFSSSGDMALAQYACMLVKNSKTVQYSDFSNQLLASSYNEKYVSSMCVGAGLVTDGLAATVYALDGADDTDIRRALESSICVEGQWLAIDNIFNRVDVITATIEYPKPIRNGVLNHFILDCCHSPSGGGLARTTFDTQTFHLDTNGQVDYACAAEIQKCREKQIQALKDMPADALIAALNVYCKPAGIALNAYKLAIDNKGKAAKETAYDVLDTIGNNKLKTSVKVTKVLDNLIKKIEDGDESIEMLCRVQSITMFDSALNSQYLQDCQTDFHGATAHKDYNVKLCDYDKIRALRRWDDEGLKAIAGGDTEFVSEYENVVNDYTITLVDASLNHWWNTRYSEDDIKSAMNAVVYGCNDSAHSSGDYTSIYDIPTELRTEVITQLDAQANVEYGESTSIETAYVNYAESNNNQ